ncbi:MAG: hypothetical protein EZS28_033441, partial [Streblomastix strix]
MEFILSSNSGVQKKGVDMIKEALNNDILTDEQLLIILPFVIRAVSDTEEIVGNQYLDLLGMILEERPVEANLQEVLDILKQKSESYESIQSKMMCCGAIAKTITYIGRIYLITTIFIQSIINITNTTMYQLQFAQNRSAPPSPVPQNAPINVRSQLRKSVVSNNIQSNQSNVAPAPVKQLSPLIQDLHNIMGNSLNAITDDQKGCGLKSRSNNGSKFIFEVDEKIETYPIQTRSEDEIDKFIIREDISLTEHTANILSKGSDQQKENLVVS